MLRQCLAIQTDSLQQNIGIWRSKSSSIVQCLIYETTIDSILGFNKLFVKNVYRNCLQS